MNSNQISAVLIGGILLGIWLFLALFNEHFGTEWGLWGLLGLVIAGGMYGVRLATSGLRIVLWIVLGIAMGMLVAGFFTDPEQYQILGAFATMTGAGLIALVAPTPQDLERERLGTWIVDEETREGQQA